MDLGNRLKHSLVVYAALPVYIALAVFNIALGGVLLQRQNAILQDLAARAAARFDLRLQEAATRLHVLAGLPLVDSQLTAAARLRSSSLQRQEEMEEIRRAWPGLARDDTRVREVLDNTVGEMFQRLSVRDLSVARILLTDRRGFLISASDKPALYDMSAEPWWALARDRTGGTLVSEGVTAGGVLGLALAVNISPGRSFGGILREEVHLDRLTAGVLPEEYASSSAVLLAGRLVVRAAGEADIPQEVFALLGARVNQENEASGRLKGVRYASRTLETPVVWAEPVAVVVARPGGPVPAGVMGAVTGSLAVSVLIAIGWTMFCRKHMGSSFLTPHRELLEAGDWILRTALGRPSVLQPPSALDHTQSLSPKASPLQKELQSWLHRLLQDLHDEYTSHTYEMQRDLSLARDFQQAYLNRPYPKVPVVHVAGRLRLDFCHRYEPALALGGDFYDIITLAPDCAGVFIADVMGHGTRSALITAILRTLIDDLSPQGRNARHFLTEMNKQFCGLLKSVPNPVFASAFYFVSDTTARVATFSSAGHPAPFHIRRSVGRVTRMEVPMPRGSALGLLADGSFTGGYTRLIDGDLFLFFTDGVYEARNVHGEEFGIARMESVLHKLMYRSAREIVDGLMESISNFVSYEPISDDICMVAVEVTTKTVS